MVAVHRACSSDSRSYEIVAHGACDTTLESLCMCAVREREGGGERPREKGLRVRHETTMTRAETAIQRGEKRETGEERVQSCGHSGECTGESVEYSEVSDAEGPSDECASQPVPRWPDALVARRAPPTWRRPRPDRAAAEPAGERRARWPVRRRAPVPAWPWGGTSCGHFRDRSRTRYRKNRNVES